jgi:hypothetical protein
MTLPSEFDKKYEKEHRDFINNFISSCVDSIELNGKKVLEIGPSITNKLQIKRINAIVETLDIDKNLGPTYTGDITQKIPEISDGEFDVVIVSEVLEHVVDPFAAVKEISRIVADKGHVIVTVPLNARIHGPIPDCWRFTEFGLKVMFRNFNIVDFKKLDTPDRNLFPLHYGVLLQHQQGRNIPPQQLVFKPVD